MLFFRFWKVNVNFIDQIRINLNHIDISVTYTYIDTDILFAVSKCLFDFKTCVSMTQQHFKNTEFYFDVDNFSDKTYTNLDYYQLVSDPSLIEIVFAQILYC
jgi:hypothetical protein